MVKNDFGYFIYTYKNYMKKCSICNKSKENSNFFKKKGTNDGLTSACKDCINKKMIDFRKKNSDKIRKFSREYYLLHKDEINKQRREKTESSELYKERLMKKQAKELKLKEIQDEHNILISKFIEDFKIINDSKLKNFILYNLLIKYEDNIGINSVKLRPEWFISNKFEKYLLEIIENTKFLNKKKNVSLSERIYCILFDIHNVKKCVICDKDAKYPNFIDGYKIHCGDRNCSYKLKSIIKDDNGLTATDRTKIGILKYLGTKDENGVTNAIRRSIKSSITKSNTIINGLDGFERGFKNGAGKNSSIKYYNSNLYYQGTYEKNFLDLMDLLGLLLEVKRGDRIKYINIRGVECVYRSDYRFRDIIFEIKSDYTYGHISKYNKKPEIIQMLNYKRINNNLKFKYTLLEGKKIILIINKKYYLKLNLNMLNDLNVDLLDKKLCDLSEIDFKNL